jgi:glycogen debranching enzyme
VYLADYVDGEHKDFSVRPNQIIAAALPYSPLAETLQHSITETVKSELLTPRGLRSLAPKNPIYEGIYEGNQASRDRAYHNGTVWVWLLSFYAEIYLKLHGRGGLRHIRDIYAGFEPTMYEHGITTISEIYDGNPPHYPKGAISQAWSVGAILLIEEMLEE